MEEIKKEESQQELPNLEETIKELKEQLEKALKEKEEYLAGWQRAKSEFLNYQQEEEKRRQEYIRLANFNLVSELINVLDSFDLAIEEIKEEKILKGFILIKSQLEGILKKYGLEILEPQIGDEFNPQFHEVISKEICQKENCNKSDEGKIEKILARGYLLNGFLVRPAKVSVIFHQNSGPTQKEST